MTPFASRAPTTARSTVRRRRPSPDRLVVAVTVAVLLAACTSGREVAAVVGDTEITADQVAAAYRERADAPGSTTEPPPDGGSDAIDPELQREVVTNLIRRELLRRAADDQGVDVTEADLAAERAALVERLGGQDELDALLAAHDVTEDGLRDELRDQAIQTALGRLLRDDVTQADVRAAFDADPQDRYGPTLTVRHIVTGTPDGARDAMARIAGGEPFPAVARAVSEDATSARDGGTLGAITRGQTVPAFEAAAFAAAEGALVGPVETSFGFHVLQVTDRAPAPRFADVEGEIRDRLEQAAADRALGGYLAGLVDAVPIAVDAQYGRWDDGAIGVVSTARPETPKLPAAPGAPSSSTAPTG